MGKLKDQKIKEYLESPISVGDRVMLNKIDCNIGIKDVDSDYIVTDVNNDTITIDTEYGMKEIPISKVKSKNTNNIGVNPLPENKWNEGMEKLSNTIHFVYDNRGVTFEADKNGGKIYGLNFNPYITDSNGNKVYYQRDLCWTLEDKQNFIESIYQELNCGVIVLRYNSDKRMHETGYEFDVIDGKQRLHTLIEFFNDEFPDNNGNFFSDFSVFAKREFLMLSPMTFYIFRSNVTDSRIKNVFLNVNFAGVPMSKEHIEFVKSINI